MSHKNKKMNPTSRQNFIIETLKLKNKPIIGNELATATNVSRQVIVQDISILRAKGEPILATSQGYVYLSNQNEVAKQKKIIAVKHSTKEVEKELSIITNHGVTVNDVIVEHPVYGEITASILVSTPEEVKKFIQKIAETDAVYLSSLTDGVHLHTLEADSIEKIKAACKDLAKAGILLHNNK